MSENEGEKVWEKLERVGEVGEDEGSKREVKINGLGPLDHTPM